MLPSLAFDNGQKFSLLPLVDIAPHHAGNPRSGQLVSPNFVIPGKPTHYETYHSGRTLIFRVNSTYILYENYTATHFNLSVSLLHVPLTTNETILRPKISLFYIKSLQKPKMVHVFTFAFICHFTDAR